jgi:cytochrome P450
VKVERVFEKRRAALETVITEDQLRTREVIADPYPAYRQLRERSPFKYVFVPAESRPGLKEPILAWAFLKHDDVYGALRDHEAFSSARPAKWSMMFPPLVLIEDDPPRHTRFRRLVNKAFTMRRIEELTPWITAVANELIDHLESGENDIVPAYAIPLPVRVIARLLGIPGEDYETFKRWSDAFLSTVPTDQAQNLQNVGAMLAYFGKTAAARREQGAADLITALVEAEVDGEKLEEWEILGFCVLLLIAGNETTTNLIGNMLNALAERPRLWEQLREDRSLLEQVIDESLRHESPVQRLSRYATRDIEVSGVRIPAGDIVRIYYGAANRDPKAFSDPDEFRLDRDLRNHVGFGMGIHYCLGAPLARVEARITLNALLDRYSGIKRGPSPAVRQTASPVVFGFQHLPLVLQR